MIAGLKQVYKKNHTPLLLAFVIIPLITIPPKQTHAGKYVIDPVGLTYVVTEHPFNCQITYYQFDENGTVIRFGDIQGSTDPPNKRAIVISAPLLPGTPELRGHQTTFGYQPHNNPDCPSTELISMENTAVLIEQLPFVPPVKIGTRTLIDPAYIYHSITFPSGVKFHIYILPYSPQPPFYEPRIYNPVIFIHGLGGRPEDWTNGNMRTYLDRFRTEGYPEEYLVPYSYADTDGNPDTYDYQGDITMIDNDLPGLVTNMATRYEEKYGDCNDSCIDIVGFSLGGIVARQYLNENPTNNSIRKIVTIGSPHNGSWLLNVLHWTQSAFLGSKYIKSAFETAVNTTLINRATRNNNNQPIDIRSTAVLQMYPASEFLQQFNNFFYPKPSFSALFGDIDAQLNQNLFQFELKTPKFSVGDVLVDKHSASYVPAVNLTTKEFSDQTQTLGGKISISKQAEIYNYSLDFISTEDLKYFHSDLPTQTEVIEEVLQQLKQ